MPNERRTVTAARPETREISSRVEKNPAIFISIRIEYLRKTGLDCATKDSFASD